MEYSQMALVLSSGAVAVEFLVVEFVLAEAASGMLVVE